MTAIHSSPLSKRKMPPEPRAVLAKAAVRAARLLHLNNRQLSQILGVSEPVISRMDRHGAPLPGDAKKIELATLFVRVYRSLDAIVGGDDAAAAAWLRAENTALGRRPIDAIVTIAGLTDTLAYLDARRAIL
jgi:hypothetical protein